MRRPSSATMLVGHPLASALLLGGGLMLIVASIRAGSGGIWVIVVTLIALVRVAKAAEQVNAYTAWKREWDAMSNAPVRQLQLGTTGKRVFLLLIVLAMAAYLYANRDQPGYAMALSAMAVIAAIGICLLAAKAIRRRSRPNRRARSDGTIAVCARPLLPTPPVNHAYAALPEHCLRILGDGQ